MAAVARDLYDVDLRELNGLWCALGQAPNAGAARAVAAATAAVANPRRMKTSRSSWWASTAHCRGGWTEICGEAATVLFAMSFLLCANHAQLKYGERHELGSRLKATPGSRSPGKVKEKWGKLTDDDLTVINGKQEQLVGRVQGRYGIAKDEAERQVQGVGERHVEDDGEREGDPAADARAPRCPR